nr:hypothetical protein BaRGS_004763 [Batillaria attramentaria]
MGINKLNEMVRQIRDLTGLKSSNDTSPIQYLPPNSQDLPLGSEFSNASSEPSNSRDGHNQDGLDFEGQDETPAASPQLTIDMDETYNEPSASTSAAPYSQFRGSNRSAFADEDDPEDFIGVEQAKELVVDIIQRMDLADIVPFDRWLKTMHITREPATGRRKAGSR